MQRGIRRMEIFKECMNYQVFLLLLKKALERYGGIVHAYCLMTNHYHLLLETEQQEVWKIMKMISHQYAMYYNNSNGYMGHLFEGRYKACIVRDDTYFLQTSRYIHLNPVKTGMVAHPEDYRWSSYCTMIGLSDDRLTETNKTLAYFKSPNKMRYREFVEDIGHKYVVDEEMIRKEMGENEIWLPW